MTGIENSRKVMNLFQGMRDSVYPVEGNASFNSTRELRIHAVMGEMNAIDRIDIMLEPNIATVPELNEKYLATMIEAMFLAHYKSADELVSAMRRKLRETTHADRYYPACLIGMLRAVVYDNVQNVRKVTAFDRRAATMVGSLMQDYAAILANYVNQPEQCCSSWALGQLSDLFHLFIRDQATARLIVDEMKKDMQVPDSAHMLMDQLLHRLFSTLSFTQKFSCLNSTVLA